MDNDLYFAITDIDRRTVLAILRDSGDDLEIRMNRRWVSLDKIDDYDGLPLVPVQAIAVDRFDQSLGGTIEEIDSADLESFIDA